MRSPRRCIDKEWRRVLALHRRQGAKTATIHIASLLKQEDPPRWHAYKYASYLLRKGLVTELGAFLRTIDAASWNEPLFDGLYAKWLWGKGNRAAAIRYLTRRVAVMPHSTLFALLASMHRVCGNTELDKKCLGRAELLAEQELKSVPQPRTAQDGFGIRYLR